MSTHLYTRYRFINPLDTRERALALFYILCDCEKQQHKYSPQVIDRMEDKVGVYSPAIESVGGG